MSAYLASIVRTSLAALAGFLVVNNILPQEMVEAFVNTNTTLVVGIIMWIVTQGWSSLNAKKKVELQKEVNRNG